MTMWDDIDYRPLSQRVHLARKEYTCVECRQPIKPGTPYLLSVSMIDNEFNAIKRHADQKICDEYFYRVSEEEEKRYLESIKMENSHD